MFLGLKNGLQIEATSKKKGSVYEFNISFLIHNIPYRKIMSGDIQAVHHESVGKLIIKWL